MPRRKTSKAPRSRSACSEPSCEENRTRRAIVVVSVNISSTVRQLLPHVLPAAQRPRRRLAVRPARKVISLLPQGARTLSLTGGEADAARGCVPRPPRALQAGCAWALSAPAVQRPPFRRPQFTRRYAAVGLADIMAGIPVYAPEPGLHDFIVQAAGAFNETVHGILNLASLG